MLNKKDIRSVKMVSSEKCLGCDQRIQAGDFALQICIHLPWPVGTLHYHTHKTCGAEIHDLIGERLVQIGKNEAST